MNLHQTDLDKLNALYLAKKASLVFLSSLPGVGKTTLLSNFAQEKKHNYYSFRQAIDNLAIANEERHKAFSSWRAYLSSFIDGTDKQVIIFDCFENVGQEKKLFLEQLFEFYNDFQNSNIMIIISSRKFLVDDIEAFLTLENVKQIALQPLSYRQLKRIYPNNTPDQIVALYSLTGGIIELVNLFYGKEEEVMKQMFDIRDNFIKNKIEALLLNKLRDLSTYNLFLSLLAQDVRVLNDLKQASSQERAKVSVYINNLIDIDLVQKDNFLRANYYISNPLIKFYYRFIYPNLSLMFNREPRQLYQSLIKPHLNRYYEDTFKTISLEYLEFQKELDLLPFKVETTSKFEQFNQTIDFVLSGDNHYIFANCHYADEPLGVDAYYVLNSRALNISRDESKNYYYLFSKSGFDDNLKELSKDKRRIRLIDLHTLHNL